MESFYTISLLFCCNLHIISAQLILQPDTGVDVQLQSDNGHYVTVRTTLCDIWSHSFLFQYITEDNSNVVFDVGTFEGRIVLINRTCTAISGLFTATIGLWFKDVPELVGMTLKLKVITSPRNWSIISQGTFTFPAPLNLTGSSKYAILNTSFTWTCTVPRDIQYVEWYRNHTKVGLVHVHDNGTCIKDNVDETYQYNCVKDSFTLTIPGSALTEKEQDTLWRCQDAIGGVENGSRYRCLNISIPVTNLTLTPVGIIDVPEDYTAKVSCRTSASRPAASILWYKDNAVLNSSIQQRYERHGDKYVTTSTLWLTAIKQDQGKMIYCKASNVPEYTEIKSAGSLVNIITSVIFEDDTDVDVTFQSGIYHSVSVRSTKCSIRLDHFQFQYITVDDSNVVYDIGTFVGRQSHIRSICSAISFLSYVSIGLGFLDKPELVGTTLRLKVTDVNQGSSIISQGTFTFPAPLNLTGSSKYAILNTSFTWTCTVPRDIQYVEWYRNHTKVGLVHVHDNGTCIKDNVDGTYQYNCVKDSFTLTIPGSALTEKEQDTLWRCQDANGGEENGSRYQDLNISIPVTSLTLTPAGIINVPENYTANISCITSASRPAASVLWYKDNIILNENIVEIHQRHGDRYVTTSTLWLTGNKQDQGKMIYCKASNVPEYTEMKSAVSSVNIITPAEFDKSFYIFKSELYAPGLFTIPFYSYPRTKLSGVKWINKTGHSNYIVYPSDEVLLSLIDAYTEIKVNNVTKVKKGQMAIMNIKSFRYYHKGNYTLTVTNDDTIISGVNILLDLSETPHIPPNVTVQCKSGSAKLSWISIDNCSLTWVMYKRDSELIFHLHQKQYTDFREGLTMHASISNLVPGVIYNFKVISKTLDRISSSEIRNCVILENESCCRINMAGVIGGIAGSVAAVIVLLSIILLVKRKGCNWSMKYFNRRSSTEKNEDFIPRETQLNEHATGCDTEDSSVYEELQNTQDVHEYRVIDPNHSYTNIAM